MKQIQWVNDIIDEKNINSWIKGDVITIKAGTGKGKSHFIKNDLCQYAKEHNKKILLMVHRLDCQEQFKMDIEGMEDTITILTYQSIDKIYENDGFFNFRNYEYIVCDEFHYFTSDASFNNTTDMSINAILTQTSSIKIFMSATADLMQKYLNIHRKIATIDYEIDIDFDFIDQLYFYTDESTEEAIIEEVIEKGEKIIVFANDLRRLERLYFEYKDYALFNCSENAREYMYVDENKITTMLKNSMFSEQVLLTTSVMDTGVSIKDKKVKHIICNNVIDINVLIQSIGRKRIMDKNDKINIYVKDINNNVLGGYITQARTRVEKVLYLKKHGENTYIRKYKKIAEDKSIIYFDIENDQIVAKINDMAYFKTLVDILELEIMLKNGYKDYVARALGKQYKIIEAIIEKDTLEKYLDGIVGKKLYREEQDKLIEIIDVKVNGRQQRSYNKLNEGLKMIELPYIILPKKSNGNRYWVVDKIFI